jgi:hypothetical protein
MFFCYFSTAPPQLHLVPALAACRYQHDCHWCGPRTSFSYCVLKWRAALALLMLCVNPGDALHWCCRCRAWAAPMQISAANTLNRHCQCQASTTAPMQNIGSANAEHQERRCRALAVQMKSIGSADAEHGQHQYRAWPISPPSSIIMELSLL